MASVHPTMTRTTAALPHLPGDQGVRRLVEPVAFWASVLLPVAYFPLLYGDLGGREFALFLALVALNVVCLVLGQEHRAG